MPAGSFAPRRRGNRGCPLLWWVMVLLLCPWSVAAQNRSARQVVFAMGPSAFDLAGTGTGVVSAARFEWSIRPPFQFEVGLTGFTGSSPAGQRAYFLPEAGLHLQWSSTRAAGYLGAGAGLGIPIIGAGSLGPTYHGTAGLRIRVARATLLQIELRARPIRPSRGHTTDFTLGMVRSIRR